MLWKNRLYGGALPKLLSAKVPVTVLIFVLFCVSTRRINAVTKVFRVNYPVGKKNFLYPKKTVHIGSGLLNCQQFVSLRLLRTGTGIHNVQEILLNKEVLTSYLY
jgi:hypothetical protein